MPVYPPALWTFGIVSPCHPLPPQAPLHPSKEDYRQWFLPMPFSQTCHLQCLLPLYPYLASITTAFVSVCAYPCPFWFLPLPTVLLPSLPALPPHIPYAGMFIPAPTTYTHCLATTCGLCVALLILPHLLTFFCWCSMLWPCFPCQPCSSLATFPCLLMPRLPLTYYLIVRYLPFTTCSTAGWEVVCSCPSDMFIPTQPPYQHTTLRLFLLELLPTPAIRLPPTGQHLVPALYLLGCVP